MGIIFSTGTRRTVNTLAKLPKRTVNSTWLELLNYGPANIKRTVKNACLWLQLLKYKAYGMCYGLITCGLLRLTTSFIYKYIMSSSSNKWSNHIPQEISNKWSNHIPQEIMEQILQRLCAIDYVRVSKVCPSWRSAVARATAERRCAPKYQFIPQLLMFKTLYSYPTQNPNPNPNQFLDIKDHTLVNLFDGSLVSHATHSELFGKYCCGSIEGWLIITDAFLQPHLKYYTANNSFNVYILFFNPSSRKKIWLPPIIGSPKNKILYFLRKVVASSVPDSPDCLVAAISTNGDIISCRLSSRRWITLHVHRDQEFLQHREIGIHDGKLYALSFFTDDIVSVFNLLNHPSYTIQHRVVLKMDPFADDVVIDSWVRHNHLILGSNISCYHLVTDIFSNELLLIMQIAYEGISPPKAKLFRVYRFDQIGPDRARWLHLESLGDRILFISHTSCMCISASVMRERGHFESEEVEDELLKRGNCIVFAFDYDCDESQLKPSSKARDVGVFSLADGRITRKRSIDIHRSSTTRPPVWFRPSME